MTSRTSAWCGLIAALTLIWAFSVRAAEPAVPSAEVRQKMAAVHQQMADCLRSDRPIAECRTEMMKSCQELVGQSSCPMIGSGAGGMGPGMMGGGTMGGGMMGAPVPETPKK
jgi:hypothetical protein